MHACKVKLIKSLCPPPPQDSKGLLWPYLSYIYTVVLTVHPLNFSFDSSKLNDYAYTCTLLKLHYYVKDQQIDAKELQGCLTSSGISGSYHRKYDFMDFIH